MRHGLRCFSVPSASGPLTPHVCLGDVFNQTVAMPVSQADFMHSRDVAALRRHQIPARSFGLILYYSIGSRVLGGQSQLMLDVPCLR